MSDAYSEWLDIPANLRPPTYYQLLGISPSELDPKAISSAAEGRLDRLRSHEAGPRADEFRRIALEIAQARDTLLDPVTRLRYDTMSPDAADPWWKPEPATPITQPVEGWWQGESPDPDLPLLVPDAPAASSPELSPPPSPVQAKSADWWKAAPGDAHVNELPAPSVAPPPVPIGNQIVPAVTPSASAIPVRAADSPAVAPVIREQSLTFATPNTTGSPMMWVIAILVVLGVVGVGAGVVYLMKPGNTGEPPDNQQLAEHKPKADTTTAIIWPNKDEPSPRPTPTLKAPGPKTIGTEPEVGTKDPEDVKPPPAKDPKPASDADDFNEAITFRGHKGGVYGLAVSRSGKTILSISDDQSVLHYSPQEKGKHGQLHRLGSPGIAVALCNDDRDAVFCDGGDVVVYDVPGRKPRATFENPRGGIRSLAPAPDCSFVLTGTTDGCVRWWNTRTKTLEHTLDVDAKATVTAVAIAADAQTAAFGLSDGRVAAWNLKSRREVKRWKAHAGAVTALAYAPDGQRLVSAGEDGVAIVWQPDGKLVQKLAGHDGPVTGAAWCSDGKRVVTAGIDRQVRLWDQDRGWKADWSTAVADKAFCLALDSRDRFVLVGLSDGAVRLEPLPKGQ